MAGKTKKYYDKNPKAKAKKKKYDKKYQATEEQKKNRASRNAARNEMKKKGKVRKGDGKDVDHKNGNPKDNRVSNLKVIAKSKNRAKDRPTKKRKTKKRS